MATVLIVDDEQDVREHLCLLLSRHGHRTVSAEDTAQALSMFDAHRPDLVITDFIMPESDGFSFVRQLRARPGGAEARVIFCTAAIAGPQMRALAKTCGVEVILEKPCKPNRILEAVEEALRSAPRPVEIPADLDRDHLRVLANQLTEKVHELEKELTRRRQLEATVQRMQGRLLRAEEDAQLGSWELPFASERGWWSPEVYRLFERDPALGPPTAAEILDLVHPDDRDRFVECQTRISQTTQRVAFDFRTNPERISARNLHLRSVPVVNGAGAVVRLGGTVQDITERVQIEAALRDSEAKFRLLAERIHDVFWISTPAVDRIIYVSPAYEDVWGRTCASLYQEPRSFVDAIHPDDRDRVVANFQNLGRTHWEIEYRIFRTDGSLRWILDRGFPVRNERGEVTISCGVAKDITERHQAQEAIHQANQRMRVLARRVLEIQEAERRRLARELHDEIGQVLSAVSVNLKIVKTKVDHSVWPRLEESAQIVDHAVEQVRNLSLDLRPSVLDDFGLESALRWYAQRLSERTGLYIHFSAKLAPVELSADVRSACFRVAQEALTNVVRHACAGEVWIELQPSDTQVRLTIRDDGKGFDVDGAYRNASQGTSLGLLSMKERIELLGGTIDFESAAGRGTSVRVWLPVVGTAEKAGEAS